MVPFSVMIIRLMSRFRYCELHLPIIDLLINHSPNVLSRQWQSLLKSVISIGDLSLIFHFMEKPKYVPDLSLCSPIFKIMTALPSPKKSASFGDFLELVKGSWFQSILVITLRCSKYPIFRQWGLLQFGSCVFSSFWQIPVFLGSFLAFWKRECPRIILCIFCIKPGMSPFLPSWYIFSPNVINGTSIYLVAWARNLGVILDATDSHILCMQLIAKSSWIYI